MNEKEGCLGKYTLWCEDEISIAVRLFLEKEKEIALKALINIMSEDLLTIGRINGYLHGLIKVLEIFNKQSYSLLSENLEKK